MKRRSFLRTGFAAAVAPAVLPFPITAAPARPWPAGPVRLSSNENPLGIPASARSAIEEGLAAASQYPQLDATLKQAIARKHGVAAASIVLGAGSTDVLRMIVQSVVSTAGSRLIVPEPTFEHVEGYAAPFAPDVVKVPLRPDHALDLDAMRSAARGARGEVLMFLCNPNNPTGTITPCDEIEALVKSVTEKFFFVIDEAYFDYVDDPTYRTLIPLTARPNVLVSRTFSKVYGLAGLRLGYGIALPETVERMEAFRLNNNANHVALVAALGCIEDQGFIRRSIESNRRGRQIAQAVLTELDLPALPSHTNFIMHRIKGDLDQYRARMLDAGFRTGRAFPPMLDHNRVSIGLPSEMEGWAAALREFRTRGWV